MLQLKFDPFPVLETQRLLLRRVEEKDAPEIFYFRSDPAILKHLGKEPAKDMEEVKKFMTLIDDLIISNESIYWGIALKEAPEKLAGTICLWQIQQENYRAEIGYVLDPHHWGKGIMKEAILQVLDYAFHTMGLRTVEARFTPANTASARVLQAAGFNEEARIKEDFDNNGIFEEIAVYTRNANE